MRSQSTLALIAAAALSACSSSSPSGPGASGGSSASGGTGGTSASGGSTGTGGGTGGLGSGGAAGSHATGGSLGSGGTAVGTGGAAGSASTGAAEQPGSSSSRGGASGGGGSATGGAGGGLAHLGPCDIYAAANTPCVSANSTVRALYAAYSGKLYQVRRASDMTTHDIPTLTAGGLADSAQQDTFCMGTTCTVSIVYDQSPMANHMPVSGPVHWLPNGGKEANATGARITIGGHTVYGILFPVRLHGQLSHRRAKGRRDRRHAGGHLHGRRRQALQRPMLLRLRQRRKHRQCRRPGHDGGHQLQQHSQLVGRRRQRSLGDDGPRIRRLGRRQRHGSKQHPTGCEIRDRSCSRGRPANT